MRLIFNLTFPWKSLYFLQEENYNDVQIDSSNQNQQTNYTNINDINVEANLAILQNRLLSATNKFGITLIKGEFLKAFFLNEVYLNSNRKFVKSFEVRILSSIKTVLC